jgi:hypothetical protein
VRHGGGVRHRRAETGVTILLAFAAVAVAVCALEGLGMLAIRGAGRLVGGSPPWDAPGVRGAVGVVVLSVVASVAAPTGTPMRLPFAALVTAGLAAAFWYAWRARAKTVDRRVLGLRIGVLVVLGAWVTIWALARPLWNLCDDPTAYLPLGDALLHGDGLDQPFSQRRTGTLGAFLPLQFFGSVPLGPLAATFGDTIVCPLLTAMALLWSSRAWAGLVFGVGGALVAVLGAVGRINLGASGATILLLLALGIIAARSLDLRGRPRLLSVAVGACLAATLVAFRLHNALVALAPLGLLVFAHPAGERLRRAAVGVGGGVVAIAGWSVASWQATGTPLFPILGKGTLNPDWAGYDDPAVSGVGILASRSLDVLAYADTWFVLLAAAAVAGMMMLHGHASTFAVPAAMLAAAAVMVVAFPVLITTADPADSWRLTRPLVVGALLVVVAQLARTIDTKPVAWRSEAAMPVAVAAFAGAFLFIGLGQVPWADVTARSRDLGGGIADAEDFQRDPWAVARGPYDELVAALPGDAVVAYAVDEAALMRRAGRTAYNLDVIGANSPSPGMPFSTGPQAKLDYLRSQGITHLVTVDADRSVCFYRRSSWQANVASPQRVYQLWAPYFLDWITDSDLIAKRPGTLRFGPLRATPVA